MEGKTTVMKALDCFICQETLRSPILKTKCDHSFCESCIIQFVRQELAPVVSNDGQLMGKFTWSCPLCDRQHNGPPEELARNHSAEHFSFHLTLLLDKLFGKESAEKFGTSEKTNNNYREEDHNLHVKIRELRRENDDIRKCKKKLQNEHQKFGKENKSLRGKIIQFEHKIQNFHIAHQNLNVKITKLQAENDDINNCKKKLQEAHQNVHKENDSLKSKNMQFEQENKTLREKNQNLNEKIAKLQSENDIISDCKKKLQEIHQNFHKENKSLRSKIIQFEQEIKNASKENQNLSVKIGELQAEYDHIRNRSKKLEEEHQIFGEENDNLKTTIIQFEHANENIREENQNLKIKYEKLQAEKDHVGISKEKLQAEHQNLSKEKESLQEQIKLSKQENESLHEVNQNQNLKSEKLQDYNEKLNNEIESLKSKIYELEKQDKRVCEKDQDLDQRNNLNHQSPRHSAVTLYSFCNQNLTLNNWLETWKTPGLTERIAAGLVRLTLHGLEENLEEDSNFIIRLREILSSKGIEIPIEQQYAKTDQWRAISTRISNYLRVTEFSNENFSDQMKMTIIRALDLLFGQMINVFYRQRDFTTDNMYNLLITSREILGQILEINRNLTRNSQMSFKDLIEAFVGILLYYYDRFLKATAFGQWIVNFTWKKTTFTKKRFFDGATICFVAYFIWKKVNDPEYRPVQLFMKTPV